MNTVKASANPTNSRLMYLLYETIQYTMNLYSAEAQKVSSAMQH